MPTEDFFERLESALANFKELPDGLEDLYQEAWTAYRKAGKPYGDAEGGFRKWLEEQEEQWQL